MAEQELAHRLRPRLGIVITTWTQEDGADYARSLVDLFPTTAPLDRVTCIISPTLLEVEGDIPPIKDFLAGQAIDLLLLVPGNFTLDHVMPLMAEAMDMPAVVWGLPTEEAWAALVGVQQTLYPFKELGLPYWLVIGELADERVWNKIVRYARASALVQRMRGMRIGLMGWRAQGMSDVVFDELAIRETFGVQVVNLGLTRYSRAVEAVPAADVKAEAKAVRGKYQVDPMPDSIWEMGIRSYLAMKGMVEAEGLQGITLVCFHDHLGEPCLGCSIFNDEGIASPCEADVHGAVMMLAGQILSGEPGFHVDIFRADLRRNTAIMAHCGNLPRRLAAEPSQVRLTRAREFGGGFAGPIVKGTVKPGPVTIVNLVGRRGTMRICAMDANVESDEFDFPGAAAEVTFPFDLAEALERLGNEGYGHHFVLFPGHFAADIAEWSDMLGVEFLLLGG
jgi:L-fucose isomerase-like protein